MRSRYEKKNTCKKNVFICYVLAKNLKFEPFEAKIRPKWAVLTPILTDFWPKKLRF